MAALDILHKLVGQKAWGGCFSWLAGWPGAAAVRRRSVSSAIQPSSDPAPQTPSPLASPSPAWLPACPHSLIHHPCCAALRSPPVQVVDDEVVVCKMNPVNEYLGPFIR